MKMIGIFVLCLLGACSKSSPPAAALSEGFEDLFERAHIGPNYSKYGGTWNIDQGVLTSHGDRNIPLWLNRQLPANVKIDVDVWSTSVAVDMKIELFGDGIKHESGYIIIFGGWKNKITAIARLDEHEKRRKDKKTKWKKGQKYHWTIQRQGNELQFLVDDKLIVKYNDANPLKGPGHDRLGFTNWESVVHYDNLKITPL
jgi:hypothetical protein